MSIAQIEAAWQQRLDALASGKCTEDDFIDEVSTLRNASPASAWDVVALLDLRYRRGQIPAGLFHSVESKFQRLESKSRDHGDTANLSHVPPFSASALSESERQQLTAPDHVDRRQPTVESPPSPAATAAPAPANIDVGRVLRGRYLLESRLGSGGMGTVYKASDNYRCDLPESNRHVAIKILHSDLRSRPELLANLRREFYCAQALSHRNIVRVYELDQDEDVAFFTMELLDGTLLSEVIEQFHRSPPMRQYAWPVIRDIGAGLAHAHAQNVVHADLKPQNIMVTRTGDVRILDFGTSSAAARQSADGNPSKKQGALALTPAYASCELLEGLPADPRDDLYALACLSYELLAGEHPFDNKRSTEARASKRVPRRPSGLSTRQWRMLQLGLSWERKDRSMAVGEWVAEFSPRRTYPAAWWAVLGVAAVLVVLRSTWHPVAVPLTVRPNIPAAQPTLPRLAKAAVPAQRVDAVAPIASARAPNVPAAAGAATATAAPAVKAMAAPTAAAAAHTASAESARESRSTRIKDPQRARPLLDQRTRIELASSRLNVRSGQNFAELRVIRSAASFGGPDADAGFEWWTEPGSADVDFDYVPQPRIAQHVSRGRRGSSLFVKILQNPARKSPATFYVVIAHPSQGSVLGQVTRTLVTLPRR